MNLGNKLAERKLSCPRCGYSPPMTMSAGRACLKPMEVTYEIGLPLKVVENAFVYATYAALKDRKQAARVLGITLRTLNSKIKNMETDPKGSPVSPWK